MLVSKTNFCSHTIIQLSYLKPSDKILKIQNDFTKINYPMKAFISYDSAAI